MTDTYRREVGEKLAEMMGYKVVHWEIPTRGGPGIPTVSVEINGAPHLPEDLLSPHFYLAVLCPWMRERGYVREVREHREGSVTVIWWHNAKRTDFYNDVWMDEPLAAAIAALRAEGVAV